MSLPRKANGPPSLLLEPRFDSIPSDPPSVLLIGCGAVGSVVAQHLCASDDVAEVILADVDGELAKRTASRLKSPKARATQLDASDAEGLRSAMRGCGLVINTALPQFNRAVQAAALAEGLNYLDPANDSRDPFVDSDTWKAAGLTALCAMGEDPGLSNVFARYAADGVERVDSIKGRDRDTASSPDYPFLAPLSPARRWLRGHPGRGGRRERRTQHRAHDLRDARAPGGGATIRSHRDRLPHGNGRSRRGAPRCGRLDPREGQALSGEPRPETVLPAPSEVRDRRERAGAFGAVPRLTGVLAQRRLHPVEGLVEQRFLDRQRGLDPEDVHLVVV